LGILDIVPIPEMGKKVGILTDTFSATHAPAKGEVASCGGQAMY
jgi:hypothetical protein